MRKLQLALFIATVAFLVAGVYTGLHPALLREHILPTTVQLATAPAAGFAWRQSQEDFKGIVLPAIGSMTITANSQWGCSEAYAVRFYEEVTCGTSASPRDSTTALTPVALQSLARKILTRALQKGWGTTGPSLMLKDVQIGRQSSRDLDVEVVREFGGTSCGWNIIYTTGNPPQKLQLSLECGRTVTFGH